MPSLADIRARLAAQENKGKNNFKAGSGIVYTHWNIDDDETAVIRFVNDNNPNNPDFWVERNLFKFPFNGVKGCPKHGVEPKSDEVIVQVPCMEMYGKKDVVLDEVRTWFKDPTMEDMGRKYWKKRSYILQGFVRQDPMEGKDGYETPENPVRKFVLTPQIFNLIKNGLMDPEIENLPTGDTDGLDFRIKKTKKGGYSEYTASTWARKETALNQDELDAIEKYGLTDLADFLPKVPTDEEQKIIQQMFEDSVEGLPYDIEKFGHFATPYGIDKISDDKPAKSVTTETKAEPVKETLEDDVKKAEEAIVEASAAVEPKKDKSSETQAQDILAMIRSRQA